MAKVQSANSILVQKAGTTEAKVVENILSWFDKATPADVEDGATWYHDAQVFALEQAKAFDFDVELVATVIAHLSPRLHWSRNKKQATAMLAGEPLVGTMGSGIKNCTRAFNASANGDSPLATLNGPKVKAFAANILGDQDKVTVDVWCAKAALGKDAPYELLLGRKGVYDALAHCYRIAAAKRGVSPSTCQAVTWILIRGKAN